MNKTFIKIVALAFAIFVSFEVCYRLTIVYLFDGKSASVAFLSIILVVITHLLAKVIKKNNLAGTIDKVIFYIGCVGLYIPMIFLMFIGRKSLWSGDKGYFLLAILILIVGLGNTYVQHTELFSSKEQVDKQGKESDDK